MKKWLAGSLKPWELMLMIGLWVLLMLMPTLEGFKGSVCWFYMYCTKLCFSNTYSCFEHWFYFCGLLNNYFALLCTIFCRKS
ncbi:hypothetical protein GLYMA_02G186250v4 [Glycine max]|nr:hypothetical protein GLYMA_02G185750v4 [Glycine max]KAG4402394.1 hypothetical protein GLYMA_02G186250v4 [Glycine max]KAH1060992.1 hypothetical protein GYH30_004468 [Glycine max]